jgi:hypothetical protein
VYLILFNQSPMLHSVDLYLCKMFQGGISITPLRTGVLKRRLNFKYAPRVRHSHHCLWMLALLTLMVCSSRVTVITRLVPPPSRSPVERAVEFLDGPVCC